MAGVPRRCVDDAGRTGRATSCCAAAAGTEQQVGVPACAAPTTSTRSRRTRAVVPRRRGVERRIRRTSAGTPRSWSTAPNGPGSVSAATSRPTPSPRASTRSASTTSSAARTTPAAATRSTSRATAPPASMPAPSSRAGFTEDQIDGFRQELSHGGAGSRPTRTLAHAEFWSSLPSRWASARSTRSTRPASTATCTTAASRTPATSTCGPSSATARWTSPSRSARSAGGARGARQPHLRHQLQPAAARRPGRGNGKIIQELEAVLPRRRLERHQGRSGAATGTSSLAQDNDGALVNLMNNTATATTRRTSRGRRLRPRALLRRATRAPARWSRA